MFDLEQFLSDCSSAVQRSEGHGEAREVAARAVSDPAVVIKGLGEPKRAEVNTLHASSNLTVLNVVWGPLMQIPAHNHEMWAVIGVYTGREDNIFWRRIEDGDSTVIEAAGAKSFAAGNAEPLGKDIVHSVVNPTESLTGAIHVYGGDFFAVDRQEWDPETHRERPFDFERTKYYFERANALLPDGLL